MTQVDVTPAHLLSSIRCIHWAFQFDKHRFQACSLSRRSLHIILSCFSTRAQWQARIARRLAVCMTTCSTSSGGRKSTGSGNTDGCVPSRGRTPPSLHIPRPHPLSSCTHAVGLLKHTHPYSVFPNSLPLIRLRPLSSCSLAPSSRSSSRLWQLPVSPSTTLGRASCCRPSAIAPMHRPLAGRGPCSTPRVRSIASPQRYRRGQGGGRGGQVDWEGKRGLEEGRGLGKA